MKECVTTATVAVLVNGFPTDEFPLARGLHQGNPLSPFWFLLAAKGFHIMMEAMVSNNNFLLTKLVQGRACMFLTYSL